MSNKNLSRTQFKAQEIITSSADSNKQLMAFTNYFCLGDLVDIVALNSSGCRVGAVLASNLTVDAVEKGASLTFDSLVDTSTVLPGGAVGWYVVAQNIATGQKGMDRLYRKLTDLGAPGSIQLCVNIEDDSLTGVNISGGVDLGKSVQLVDDVSSLRVGDAIQLICDLGLVGNANITAIQIRADDVNNYSRLELDANLDMAGETNCKICTTALSITDLFGRIREDIDVIDAPVLSEELDGGNCIDTVFETEFLFLQGTSEPYIDDGKKWAGTAGTRSFKELGTFPASNDALRGDSLILGTLGNEVELEIVAGAGLAITVTKNFKVVGPDDFSQSQYLIQINDNTGASTTKELADALNAHAEVQRIAQFRYGGDGSGVLAVTAASNFGGGLDDGTKNYAEMEIVYENEIVNTGYSFISYHIRPDDRQKLDQPPQDDEWNHTNYRRALTNA